MSPRSAARGRLACIRQVANSARLQVWLGPGERSLGVGPTELVRLPGLRSRPTNRRRVTSPGLPSWKTEHERLRPRLWHRGIVAVDQVSPLSHVAILCRELGVPSSAAPDPRPKISPDPGSCSTEVWALPNSFARRLRPRSMRARRNPFSMSPTSSARSSCWWDAGPRRLGRLPGRWSRNSRENLAQRRRASSRYDWRRPRRSNSLRSRNAQTPEIKKLILNRRLAREPSASVVAVTQSPGDTTRWSQLSRIGIAAQFASANGCRDHERGERNREVHSRARVTKPPRRRQRRCRTLNMVSRQTAKHQRSPPSGPGLRERFGRKLNLSCGAS
jgi:hypothetical protein